VEPVYGNVVELTRVQLGSYNQHHSFDRRKQETRTYPCLACRLNWLSVIRFTASTYNHNYVSRTFNANENNVQYLSLHLRPSRSYCQASRTQATRCTTPPATYVSSPLSLHKFEMRGARTPYGIWYASSTTSVPMSMTSLLLSSTVLRPNVLYGPGAGSEVVLSTLIMAWPSALTEMS
jgi:hypothetical protein